MLCLTHEEALCDIVITFVPGVRRKVLGTGPVTLHVKLCLHVIHRGIQLFESEWRNNPFFL